MSKLVTYAGIAASVILIAFGIGAIVTGFNGRDRVRTDLAREQIVGTPDSTIPGQLVDTGSEAQAFAKVMRKHTLEATGGQTYAQMGRYLDANGKPTSDETKAATDIGFLVVSVRLLLPVGARKEARGSAAAAVPAAS
jgi:hypothetical protein